MPEMNKAMMESTIEVLKDLLKDAKAYKDDLAVRLGREREIVTSLTQRLRRLEAKNGKL